MHISKLVDYVKNEISFSKEFCKDNVFITLRIEPILKILENLEQTHKDILEYVKDIEKKDKIIDLYIDELVTNMFDRCCQECCRECEKDKDTLRNCIKQYFERKATNNG